MFSVNLSSILRKAAIPRTIPRPVSSYTESELKDIIKLSINYSVLILVLVLLEGVLGSPAVILRKDVTIKEYDYPLFGITIFIHGIQIFTTCQMYFVWMKNLKGLSKLKCFLWLLTAWFLIFPVLIGLYLFPKLFWYNGIIGLFAIIIYFYFLGQVRKVSRISSGFIASRTQSESQNNTQGHGNYEVDIDNEDGAGVGDSQTQGQTRKSIPIEEEECSEEA